jgi:hypothetical protein
MRRATLFLLLTLSALALPLQANAGPGSPGSSGSPDAPDPVVQDKAADPAAPSTDADPQPGSIGEAYAIAGITGRAGMDGSSSTFSCRRMEIGLKALILTASMEVKRFDWDHGQGSPLGTDDDQPWQDLQYLDANLRYLFTLNPALLLYAQAGVAAGYSDDHLVADSLAPHPEGYFILSLADKWAVYAGAGAFFWEPATVAYPVFGLSYNFGAKQGLVFTLGVPESTLAWHFSPGLALRATLEPDSKIHTLGKDSSAAREGYVHFREFRPGLGLALTPVPGLTLEAGARYAMARTMEILDAHGNTLASYDADGAVMGYGSLTWAF